MTARSPNTFIVGAGAVATALAGSLRQAGVPVLGLWARRPEAARAAAALAGVAAFSPAPPDLLLEAEVVIVAVKDDAVGEVASRLCGTGLVGERHVLLHCASGASAARGTADGLTGPIRRGDVGTVERHLEALAGDAELALLYRVLGRRALGLARPGLSDEAAAALADRLR